MAYADFDYYKERYAGELIKDEAEFNRLVLRASEEIDYYTGGKAQADRPSVQHAACGVAEVIYDFEESDPRNGNIHSEKIDEYSASYSLPFSSFKDWEDARQIKILEALYLYLANTGLLYTGASYI